MPGATTNFGLRYPLPGEAPEGDRDIERFAFDLDAMFTTIDTQRAQATGRPRCSLSQTTNTTSVAKGSFATIVFNGPEYDNAGMWSAANPDRITIRTTGLYVVRAHGELNTPTPPNPAQGACVQMDITVNGTSKPHRKTWVPNSSSVQVGLFAILPLNVNDVLSVRWIWLGTNPTGPLIGDSVHFGAFMWRTGP